MCQYKSICNPIIELTTLLQSCGFTIEKQELKDWHFNEFEIVMRHRISFLYHPWRRDSPRTTSGKGGSALQEPQPAFYRHLLWRRTLGGLHTCRYAYSDAEGKYAGTAARAAPPVPQSVDSGASWLESREAVPLFWCCKGIPLLREAFSKDRVSNESRSFSKRFLQR